jgi:hypothetical protein
VEIRENFHTLLHSCTFVILDEKGIEPKTGCKHLHERRDGGTGRRSGLKIRRPSGLGGSTPPPGTISKTHKIRGYLGSLSACDQPV